MLTNILADVLRKTVSSFGERLTLFLPNLLAMLILLAIGILGAGVVRMLLRLVLPKIGFDRFADRTGVGVVLRQAGVAKAASDMLALGIAWAVLGVFVLLAIGALNLEFAMGLLSQAFLYLPQLLVAVAVLVLGDLVAGFVRRSVLIAAVNAELTSARLLATGAQMGVLAFALAIALEHLGVGRQIILMSFAISFGGIVLALALAFGFAGRDMARDVLEHVVKPRMTETEPPPDSLRHL
ncbi:MAG: hypothetical protein U0Q12_16210 [Vicinamibacterales bacterium]